ncbi:alkaline phosphatase family protein [Tautonia marina]|uniref:alkaline phosphatase family protein n=1 Tax=Tautonia marina TaxID=2653855 RepID=UPI001F3E9E31|nr:alkaline phosphatase family protein [Tautonia marina]
MGKLGIERVIIVGLDGLEPTILEEMLAAGELPNFAALRDLGGYGRIGTTLPAQTPVAWSSFATGTNPGAHGIFDFVGRDPQSYRVQLALNRYEQSGVFQPPRVVNLRRGIPFWQRLSEQGIPSSVLRCPCTYPPDQVEGRMLSGMGVPDLRGGFGTGTFYSTEEGVTAGESERVVRLDGAGPELIETVILGPIHPRTREEIRVPIVLEPGSDSGTMTLRSSGEPQILVLRQGRWSDWLRVSFRMGLLQSTSGLVRFFLVEQGPDRVELYASPIQFDPQAPPFPISHPEGFADELSRAIGLYHTTGLAEDHTTLSNGRISESAFLDQCDDLWREREAMFEHELSRFQSGVLYCLFGIPDRIQHLFWRYRDPGHPANRGRPLVSDHQNAIAEAYRRSDAQVGRALRGADDRTLIVALSDHGFGSFRRGVNLNTWLLDQGLLAVLHGERSGDPNGPPLGQIDWSKTKAYAIGLGGIFLNLRGREGAGVVAPEEAEPLKVAIADTLGGLVDPATGDVAIRSVSAREQVYSGPFVEEAPDLLVRFGKGYRASWGSAMGHVGETVFEDNTRLWAGDHIVDPVLVPGVVMMNRPFRSDQASLLDLAPTVLDALGLPVDPELEGSALLR